MAQMKRKLRIERPNMKTGIGTTYNIPSIQLHELEFNLVLEFKEQEGIASFSEAGRMMIRRNSKI